MNVDRRSEPTHLLTRKWRQTLNRNCPQRERFTVRINGNFILRLVYTMTHIRVFMVKNEKNTIHKDK